MCKNKVTAWIVFYLCVSVAASSGFVFPLGDANVWFASLNRPAITPPNWVFGPVWTLLYILIATSAYRLVQKQPHPLLAVAIAPWALQLALNVIWTPVFSGAQNLQGALHYIIALWITILVYIVVSWKVDHWASCLMAPYFFGSVRDRNELCLLADKHVISAYLLVQEHFLSCHLGK